LFSLQDKIKRPPSKYYGYIDEFVELIVPTPGLNHPMSIEDVILSSSSTQKVKYENSLIEKHDLTNKAFQKTEAYPEIKDPRNITAVDPKHVVKMACFVKPIVAHLKEYTKWYVFGRNPTELSDCVYEIMQDTQSGELVNGDFSRFDGRQSTVVVDLNTALSIAFFADKYHEEIRQKRHDLSFAMFRTESKVWYNASDSNKSGSATTSIDNTVTHAFAQYCHFRQDGFAPDEAYARIGLCAGDDGLLRSRDPKGYEKTCSELNFVLKSFVCNPGDPVPFLGRIWNDWSSNESYFDPVRALSKMHFSDSSDRNIAVERLAWRKAVGYYATDAGNFIGHIAGKILLLTNNGRTEPVERREWMKGVLEENTKYTTEDILAKFTAGPVFPTHTSDFHTLRTDNGGWDPCAQHFADALGLKMDDVFDWWVRFSGITSIKDVPTLTVVVAEADKKGPAVSVDGVVIGGPMTPAPIVPKVVKPLCFFQFVKKNCKRGDKCHFEHDFSNVCFDFAKGKCKRGEKCKRSHIELSARV